MFARAARRIFGSAHARKATLQLFSSIRWISVHSTRSSRPLVVLGGRRFFASAARAAVSPRGSKAFGLAAAALGVGLFGYYTLLNEAVHAAERPIPQPTVVTPTHGHGAFVIIRLKPDANLKEVAKAVSNLPQIIKNLTNEEIDTDSNLPVVLAGVGFGTQTWEQLSSQFGLALPPDFRHYQARRGKYGALPATGGDILLHVKAVSRSLAFDAVQAFVAALPAGTIDRVDDRYGWQYQDGRDLSGFLDGTENPAAPADRELAALIPATSGSYAVHQVWLHNLRALRAQPLEVQEAIIGRSKPDSAEIPREQQKPSSHVSRMRDENFGKIPIVRQSMPFGTVGGEHGLLFLAYSNTPAKFDRMLDRMVGVDALDPVHGRESDDTMSFSRCVASQYYYIPSVEELAALGK